MRSGRFCTVPTTPSGAWIGTCCPTGTAISPPWLTSPIEPGFRFTRGHERGNTGSHVLNPLVAVVRVAEAGLARVSPCE
jgi:hypothetical protein